LSSSALLSQSLSSDTLNSTFQQVEPDSVMVAVAELRVALHALQSERDLFRKESLYLQQIQMRDSIISIQTSSIDYLINQPPKIEYRYKTNWNIVITVSAVSLIVGYVLARTL